MGNDDEVMDGPKRMQTELLQMMGYKELPQVQLLTAEKDNIFRWFALLMPSQPPYHMGAYNLQIDFPERYPFVPPILHILTKVYHPNINDHGQICLPILEAEQWKPTSRMCTILNVLMATFNDPQTDNAYNLDMANLFLNDRKKYDKIAESWVMRYAEKRPTDAQIAKIIKRRKAAAQR